MLILAALSAPAQQPGPAQQPDLAHLVTTGEVTLNGRTRNYQVRHLPASSFPDLPEQVANELNQRGCLIPQTYQAHHPENVVHGSFQRPGSSDWAVLCSVQRDVSLLVFFADTPGKPAVLATSPEIQRIQVHDSTGVLGFNWGIDAASPQTIHDAQIGISPRPARIDHDALADSILDRKTTYHYFTNAAWSLVDLPD